MIESYIGTRKNTQAACASYFQRYPERCQPWEKLNCLIWSNLEKLGWFNKSQSK